MMMSHHISRMILLLPALFTVVAVAQLLPPLLPTQIISPLPLLPTNLPTVPPATKYLGSFDAFPGVYALSWEIEGDSFTGTANIKGDVYVAVAFVGTGALAHTVACYVNPINGVAICNDYIGLGLGVNLQSSPVSVVSSSKGASGSTVTFRVSAAGMGVPNVASVAVFSYGSWNNGPLLSGTFRVETSVNFYGAPAGAAPVPPGGNGNGPSAGSSPNGPSSSTAAPPVGGAQQPPPSGPSSPVAPGPNPVVGPQPNAAPPSSSAPTPIYGGGGAGSGPSSGGGNGGGTSSVNVSVNGGDGPNGSPNGGNSVPVGPGQKPNSNAPGGGPNGREGDAAITVGDSTAALSAGVIAGITVSCAAIVAIGAGSVMALRQLRARTPAAPDAPAPEVVVDRAPDAEAPEAPSATSGNAL